MRTLVVTSTFPQWEGDPRGGFIRRFWEARVRDGEHVEVVAPRTRWCRGALDTPLDVRRYPYAPAAWSTLSGHFGILENLRARPHRALLLPTFLRQMRVAIEQALDQRGFDRVVAHMVVPCGLVAATTTSPRSVPLEVYGHGTDVDVLIGAPAPVRRRLARRLHAASVVYVPSAEKQGRFANAMPELADRCRVATMVETVVTEPVERRPVPGRILFLGRLIRQKGVDDLIRAVAGLNGGAHLHIAGDGPERTRLARLADKMGVEAVFHGYVEGSRKQAALAAAAVVCVPSREIHGLSEGAPLVVREASTLGIPVVATRVGGIPELVAEHEERVTLVPPGDRGALRTALMAHVPQS
ncbi:MAG: glycosyltransferase [Myxococcota bacterium]